MKGGGDLECSPNLENDDFNHTSGLSSKLVATIQGAKDRISQIEYIFCSQLYPNLLSNSKSLQKIYLDAKKEAECEGKEKEKHLLDQIEKLRIEKEGALEENRSLKLDNEKSLDDKTKMLLAMVTSQKTRIDAGLKSHEELEQELMRKSKEVEEGMELHNKLLLLTQTKANMLVDKERQLKMQEEKTNELVAKVKSLERRVEELQEQVRGKTERIVDEKESFKKMCRRYLSLLSVVEDSEKLKTKHEEEKKMLLFKLDCLERNVSGLQKKLNEKTEEIERGRVLQAEPQEQFELLAKVKSLELRIEELQVQVRVKTEGIVDEKESLDKMRRRYSSLLSMVEDSEKLKTEQEEEKKKLLFKLDCLEGNVSGLQKKLNEKTEEIERGRVLQAELLAQIDTKAVEILKQKQQLIESENDKKLLLGKVTGLEEKVDELQANLSNRDKEAEEKVAYERKKLSDLVDSYKKLRHAYICVHAKSCLTTENMLACGKLGDETDSSKPQQNSPNSTDVEEEILDTSAVASGIKKGKIENESGNDLVDDEMVKSIPIASHKSPASIYVPKCPPSVKSAQLIGTKRPASDWIATRSCHGKIGLKDRVECKQCKAFCDAVLPNNGGQNVDSNRQNLGCKHRDGVSRHRFKYMPPMTPEGFWNIGFESEM